MDSSPDLSVKLRRGSNDSRDSFYMGFAQGIDSDIEEVTTVQHNPPPPLYPPPEEPPIDIPAPVESSPEPEALERLPEPDIAECEEPQSEESGADEENPHEDTEISDEPAQVLLEQVFQPPLLPEDDEDTNTSVTVIQSKNKTPSSSSSSISSALNELTADDASRSPPKIIDSPPKLIDSPPNLIQSPRPHTQSVEAEIVSSSPPSHRSSPPSHKSTSHKSSPPKRLNLYQDKRGRNCDSDSIDSINAIDSKIDDDNRDDSSPTDSMPPAPTPPPLGFPLSLEKR